MRKKVNVVLEGKVRNREKKKLKGTSKIRKSIDRKINKHFEIFIFRL